jgi:SAM-dependent methyltransferase
MAAEFDSFASSYDADLERGLSLTGEGKDYYAGQRIQAVRRRLDRAGVIPRRILDFGCGTGTAAPLLKGLPGAELVLGVDPSEASLNRARTDFGAPGVDFAKPEDRAPDESFDLVFTNGVFHHIPAAQRPAAIDYVRRSLRPGGMFAFWENNPFNPGTRWVMRRVAFDREAVMLASGEARRLVRDGGMSIRATEFHFVFPRLLKWLRGLEPLLRGLPIGGQYLVIATRPE